MNKIAWYTFLSVCFLSVAGCGSSDKQKVLIPPSPAYPDQPSMVETGTLDEPVSPPKPRYLEIDDNDKVVMEDDIEATLPSMIYVNDRIFEYGRKLDRWKELDSQLVKFELDKEVAVQMVQCFQGLQEVLNGYRGLRTEMLKAQKITTAEKINLPSVLELQRSDIAFLESECGRKLEGSESESAGWSQREEGADLAQFETLIDRYNENEEFEEILQVWTQIPEVEAGRVHMRSKIIYGNALIYLQQERKAAEIYRQVVEQLSSSKAQATDIVSLRKKLADLYTASGEYKEAQSQYKKISEDYLGLGHLEEWSKLQLSILESSGEDSAELKEYSTLLRHFLGFKSDKDGYTVAWEAEKFLSNYPYSPVSSNVDFIKAAVIEEADRWFEKFMAEVEKLESAKQFKEAIELLELLPLDIVGNDKQIIVNEKNQELLLAIAVERETELMVQIQELQHKWNSGMLLVKNEEYEEALKVFTGLLETEYQAKAKQKIDEISLQAAKADRRKAADLFIRFTKTTDFESKKKLLVESRKLLKNILVKYPEVEIASKVLGNIERVEQEMTALDPNLIMTVDQQQQEENEEGLDAVFDAPTPNTIDVKPELRIEGGINSLKTQP